MKGIWEHPGLSALSAAVAEEADKEKKRRRRQNRRQKQNLPSPSGGGSVSVAGNGWAGPEKAAVVAFNSLPPMHINRGGDATGILGGFPPACMAAGEISRSCPLPATSPPLEKPAADHGKRKYFDSYWPDWAVEEAIEKGNAFKATFRVNAYNRLEAYCTIVGVPTDILISGAVAQNRAVEGDVVAIMLDPVTCWTRSKGSNVTSNPVHVDDSNTPLEDGEVADNNVAVKEHVDANCGIHPCNNGSGSQYHENGNISEAIYCDLENGHGSFDNSFSGHHYTAPESSNGGCASEEGGAARSIGRIFSLISSYPSKRPTGRVLSIIRKSPRRGAVIGFLAAKQWLFEGEGYAKQVSGQLLKKNMSLVALHDKEYVQLIPTDSKLPKMAVTLGSLPDPVKERLKNGDVTVERELVAARIDDWSEESLYPQVHVLHILGRGGEIEPQISAILFENAISAANFSPESLDCLPDVSWKIPLEEFKVRRDLRNICTFTIDTYSAVDLDDAMSVEMVSDEVFRVGIHIADVSYFVCPDTVLDTEAQIRSTSVYISQHKVPMLPPKLSEELGSLIPGVDRLAFSVILDISRSGNIVDRWIGRSIIHSCCKLSYDFVQDIIDGSFEGNQFNDSRSSSPQLHGQFEWKDIIKSLASLHEISKRLREIRFKDGALWFQNAKLAFLFDDRGTPYDSFLKELKESCSIVEEFMLLANRSVAEVISRVYPDCALLRRHPEPNLRKLKEFEAFCSKHGFELNTSSSGQLNHSLSKIREKLKNDPVLFDILISYALRPMQSAAYFCTGDFREGENEWAHYALSVPVYTHFTSPLRRYADIIVHRTVSAVLDAEEMYLKQRNLFLSANKGESFAIETARRCFTGLYFNKDAAQSKQGRQALSAAALKFKVPGTEVLAEVAAYCNERNLASRLAEDAGERLYLWALLKEKEVIVSEARIVGLGPRFMSVYINKLAIERRICYDDVDGLAVEWLEATSTLVLDLVRNKRSPRRCCPGKLRAIEGVAVVTYPSDAAANEGDDDGTNEVEPSTASFAPSQLAEKGEPNPAFFPLVLRQFSPVPVALHAIGGDDGPLDIGARLYMCSYLKVS